MIQAPSKRTICHRSPLAPAGAAAPRPVDQLVEVTAPAVLALLTVQEGELALVELFEELVPRDGLKRFGARVAGEVDAEQADVVSVAGATDARGLPAALLDPLADQVVIGGDYAFRG